MTKTNAMRLLDAAAVPYETAQYAYDESDLSGVHAAEALGMPVQSVFKTLVAQNERHESLVFCIPVAASLNLKKAAKISGSKKVELLALKQLQQVTGYLRGGCSPIGMKKKFPTYFDQSMLQQTQIAVSAGQRGRQILIEPALLQNFCQAVWADLT